MAAQPTVSVVLVAADDRRSVSDCIESLRRQATPPLEVLVVDAGSTDGTAALAEAQGGFVRVVRPAGPGREEAYRAGSERARGEVVVRAPARSWFRPDALARAPEGALHPVGTTRFGRAAAAVLGRNGALPLASGGSRPERARTLHPAGWWYVADDPRAWAREWVARGRAGDRSAPARAALVAGAVAAAVWGRGPVRVALPAGHALACAATALRAGRDRGVAPHLAFLAAEARDWAAGSGWWAGLGSRLATAGGR